MVVIVTHDMNDERRRQGMFTSWQRLVHKRRGSSWACSSIPRGGSAHVARNLAHDAAARRLGRHGPERQRHAARPSGDARALLPRPRRPPGRHDARAQRARPDGGATRRCTRPTRTARARPTASSPRSTTRTPSTRSPRGRARCSRVGAANADVLHLHHLTPLYEAAARVAPRGADRRPPARHRAADARGDRARPAPLAVRRGLGRADARLGAPRCERIIVLSETQVERAERLLPIEPERCVLIPNGFDPDNFTPRHIDHRALWQRMLVEQPRGWAPGGEPGSVRYAATRSTRRSGTARRDAGAALRRPLHRGQAHPAADRGLRARPPAASSTARRSCSSAASPASGRASTRCEAIRRLGAQDVFLAGWHEHHELPDILAATDVIVLPVRARAVRPGARRGDGVRPAGDRRRRPRPGRHRRPRRDRLAGRARRPRSGWPTRSSRPSTARTSAAAAAPNGRRGRRRPLRLARARPRCRRALRRGARRCIARDAIMLRTKPRTSALNAASHATDRGPGAGFPGGPLLLCRSLPSPRMGFRVPPPVARPCLNVPRGRIGLYDPTYEHDACGVAMVAKLDAVPIARDRRARDRRAREPRAPRRGGRRPEHGRRRRHPAPAARRVHPRRHRRRAAAAGRLRRLRLLPPARARSAARSSSSCSRQTVTDEGQRVVAWRDVPVDKDYVGITANLYAPYVKQLVVAASRRAGARPGRVRAQALRDPPRGRDRRRPGARDPELLAAARSSTRACSPARSCWATTPTCRTRARRRRWRSSTRGFSHEHVPELGARAPVPDDRPQRRDQHAAREHQLDARARVAARVASCSATTCRRCSRSSAPAAATPRRSTTCSSCSCWPAAASRTR